MFFNSNNYLHNIIYTSICNFFKSICYVDDIIFMKGATNQCYSKRYVARYSNSARNRDCWIASNCREIAPFSISLFCLSTIGSRIEQLLASAGNLCNAVTSE